MADIDTDRLVAQLARERDKAVRQRDDAYKGLEHSGRQARSLRADITRLTADVTQMAGVLVEVLKEGGPHADAAREVLSGDHLTGLIEGGG